MTKRLEVASRLLERISSSPDPYTSHRCAALGCSKPTMRGAADGVSFTYCRAHVAHKSRHGCTWRKSLTGGEVRPFQRAASRWLKANAQEPIVMQALQEMAHLMARAPQVVFGGFLRNLKPDEKAWQALARLREQHKEPRVIIMHVLTIMATLRGLDGLPRDNDFWECQIGKKVHQLAGGYSWTLAMPDGTVRRKRWNPEPRGQALRHLARLVLRVISRGFAQSDLQAIAKAGAAPAVRNAV